MRAGSRYNEGQVCAQGEERHFEVPTLASKANLCHILLIGKLETVHRPDSKCAEFTLTWLNSATKMIHLVSKGTRNSVFLKLQLQGLPWRSSGKESAFQGRGRGFDPWLGN